MNYTITGATGHLGMKITEEALKVIDVKNVTLSVRSPQKAEKFAAAGVTVKKANYSSEEELYESFKGTDVLIYIPSITHPSYKRVGEFENAMNAAERAGVKHIVFVGFIADHEDSPFKMAPFFGYAVRRLASSDLPYTYIRNAMYADPLPPYIPELAERGRLLYPAGDGKISFISRRDLAKAIVKIAAAPQLLGKKYTLTGEKNYTMLELAALLSDVCGQSIVYKPMTKEEFAAEYDQPQGFGAVLASLYTAAEKHLMDEMTDDYFMITGEHPEPLEQFVKRKYEELNA